MQSQVKFNRVPEKVPECRARSGSTEGSEGGRGSFGAEPGPV